MNKAKKAPGLSRSEGDSALQESNVSTEYTFNDERKQLAELFEEPNWVSWRAELRDGKLQKVPFNGKRGLSTRNPAHWRPYAEAQQIAVDNSLSGVGLVFTGGIRRGDHTLIGIDVDAITPEFVLPFETYAERSPSGRGIRAFVWLPTASLEGLKDTVLKDVANCKQVELYIGSAARFLTTTFSVISDRPIAHLHDLAPWKLKPAKRPADAAVPITPGAMLDLSKFTLPDGVRRLLDGEGQPVIDRSDEVYHLITELANQHQSKADILATLLQTPPLWAYLLDHRDGEDGTRAAEFAEGEVNRCFAESKTGAATKLCEITATFPKRSQPVDPEPGPDDEVEFAPYVSQDWDDDSAIDYMIYGYLENDVKALMYGPPGSCKTFAALDIAVSVASGLPWHGRDVMRPGPVLYICGEARRGVTRRLKVLCQTRGIGRDVKIRISSKPVALVKDTEAAWLHKQIARFDMPPVLIIVDTLARNFGGNENSAEDMGLYTDNIDMLRRETGATVLTVHHTGYDGKHPRGSTALFASTDAVYETEYDKLKHSLTINVERLKDEEAGEVIAFTTKVVRLKGADGLDVLDPKGKPVTSLVLESGDSRHATREAKFFEEHPALKVTGNNKFAERLPLVLRQAFYDPGLSRDDFAAKYTTSTEADKPVNYSSLELLVKRLISEGLMEKDGRKLTEAGRQAAAIFHAEIDLMLHDRTRVERPFPPPMKEDLI